MGVFADDISRYCDLFDYPIITSGITLLPLPKICFEGATQFPSARPTGRWQD